MVSVWMATCTSDLVGNAQASVDGLGSGAPVFMQLEAAGASADLFEQGLLGRTVPFAEKTEVHGKRFGCVEHARDVPATGRTGCGIGAGGGAGSASQHGGNSVRESFVGLLRADEVDVAIDSAGGDDGVLTGDYFGGSADDQVGINTVHGVGIAGFSDAR